MRRESTAVAIVLALLPASAGAGVTQAGAPIVIPGPWAGTPGGCGPPIGNVVLCLSGPLVTNAPNDAQVSVAAHVEEAALTISSAIADHSFNLAFNLTAPTTVVLNGIFGWSSTLEDTPGTVFVRGSVLIRPLPDPAPGSPPLASLSFTPPSRTTQGSDPVTVSGNATKVTLPAGGYQVRAFVAASVSINPDLLNSDDAIAAASLRVFVNDLVGRLIVAPQRGAVGEAASISLVNAGAFPADMEITAMTVTRPTGAVDAFNPGLLPGAPGGPPRIAGGLSFTALYPGAGFPPGASVAQPGLYAVAVTFDDIVEGEFEREPDCNGNGIGDTADIEEGTSADINFSGVPDECEVFSVSCPIRGVAEGGSVAVTVDGFSATCVVPPVPTAPGASAEAVVTDLAASINSDACLLAQGITGAGSGNRLTVTGFDLTSEDVKIVVGDPGLVLAFDLLKIPTLSTWGLLILIIALVAAGFATIRSRLL